MRKYDIIISGNLTALTPIHIVPPNSRELQLEDGGKAREVATVTRYIDGKAYNVPVIPGSSLRGRLRRAAAGLAFASQEGKPKLDSFLYNTIGGIKGAEKEEVFDIVARNRRREVNPVVGLFGAGHPWVSSVLHVSSAIPDGPVTAATVGSLRADDFARGADISAHLDQGGIDAYLTLRAGTKATSAAKGEVKRIQSEIAKARKSGDEAAVADLNTQINEARAKAADLKGESGNSLQMPMAHRVLPMGLELKQTFRLLGVNEVEAGLFFAALSDTFENNPLIGGKVSLGYGEVSGQWNVSMREKGSSFADLGDITGTAFAPISYKNADINGFIARWREFSKSEAFDLAAVTRAAQVEEEGVD